jgi:hypothetical protein
MKEKVDAQAAMIAALCYLNPENKRKLDEAIEESKKKEEAK